MGCKLSVGVVQTRPEAAFGMKYATICLVMRFHLLTLLFLTLQAIAQTEHSARPLDQAVKTAIDGFP